jgi:hypothetical protein
MERTARARRGEEQGVVREHSADAHGHAVVQADDEHVSLADLAGTLLFGNCLVTLLSPLFEPSVNIELGFF